MKRFVLLFGCLVGVRGYSFTLMSSNPARYSTDSVAIRIGSHSCGQIGLSYEDLRSLVSQALGQFWNTVPTSRLKFHVGESIEIAENSTLTEMVDALEDNQIIIACSNNTTLFDSANILAVGTMTSSTPARGVVAINNISGSQFSVLSEANKRATVAHEFGHAIGIGHSTHEYALMFYSLSEALKRESLARDDADAISYLYPKKSSVPILLGACGVIDSGNSADVWMNLAFVVLALLVTQLVLRRYVRGLSPKLA